ncbi:MAG TPA: flagellar motor switch protein FliM [Bacillota bacterium]|nr:flagellar motor switch protein FliM [Candidatus Fermentithermobacillaceae bacterium]HOB29998.1 flagellar motor switch protein FliM [Bacillota bacterium]HOK63869.1 flagellar motor switch protein FliM [Bacillota bacterium]HOL11443.1 flagellar motor switch protein FliM [Bacillota bacterium]HOQ03173.1 flagellar motor switch protein FliM [Bacillota bacterium]
MALTQKEIEDLINSMMATDADQQEPQVAKPRLRVYDFKRPDKFSKDHLRGIQLLFDNFCRFLTSYFSGFFRVTVHSHVESVDQITYEEFASNLPNPCVVAVVQWGSLPSNMLISFSPQIAIPMVDRLCGGTGDSVSLSRVLTDIETAVLTRVAETMTDMLSVTLREFKVEEHNLKVNSIELNPLFIQQAMAPNDVVLSVILKMKFGAHSGNIEFCLPYVLLEPILPALSAHRWFSQRDEEAKPPRTEDAIDTISHIEVPISCILGECTLTMNDILSLKPGDVIELNTRKKDPATIYILDKPKFKAEVGRIGSRLAARITSRADEA